MDAFSNIAWSVLLRLENKGFSCEQLRTRLRELHIGAAFVHRQPTALDGKLQAIALFLRRSLQLEQERTVDLLDVNAAILYRFNRIGDLDQPGAAAWGSA
jgi:hypothetical protein